MRIGIDGRTLLGRKTGDRTYTRNLVRALGLKISRVVIDAGHGGHDTGTIGPSGLMEKDLTLDVATRLNPRRAGQIPSTKGKL